jgi:hypothetical protein
MSITILFIKNPFLRPFSLFCFTKLPQRVVTKAKDKINILNMSYNCKSNHSPLQAVELKEGTNFLQSALKENWKTILCRKGPIQFSHKLALEHINNHYHYLLNANNGHDNGKTC